jgi:hypothetical protein
LWLKQTVRNEAINEMKIQSLSKLLSVAALAVLASLSLDAADVSGQWRADIETPNGLHKVLYTFHVDGSKLTGTAIDNVNGSRREGPLTEGTFTNDSVFFVTYYNADTGDVLRIEYSGTLGTNGIHFLAQVADVTTLDFFATRVEPASAVAAAADASGTWSWTTPGRNGGPERASTLSLAEDHGKLSGRVSVPGPDGASVESPISNGTADGDKISFDVVREVNGNKFTSSFSGDVGADKITGKISFNRNGELQTHDWEARRLTDQK